MYKETYNKNAQLFSCYANVLEKGEQDYIKSENYYLKALSIDNNMSTIHNDYTVLLHEHLKNYAKAEYHYKQQLILDPNDATTHYNFAGFLIKVQKKYDSALTYCDKACELSPNDSLAHYWKGKALLCLNRFDESVDETLVALKLNENSNDLREARVKEAIEQMESGLQIHMKSRFGEDVVKWLEVKVKNSDSKHENDSKGM